MNFNSFFFLRNIRENKSLVSKFATLYFYFCSTMILWVKALNVLLLLYKFHEFSESLTIFFFLLFYVNSIIFFFFFNSQFHEFEVGWFICTRLSYSLNQLNGILIQAKSMKISWNQCHLKATIGIFWFVLLFSHNLIYSS